MSWSEVGLPKLIVAFVLGVVLPRLGKWMIGAIQNWRKVRLAAKIRREVMSDLTILEDDKTQEILKRRRLARETTGWEDGALSPNADPVEEKGMKF